MRSRIAGGGCRIDRDRDRQFDKGIEEKRMDDVRRCDIRNLLVSIIGCTEVVKYA